MSLAQIAQMMQAAAKKSGHHRHRLGRGLYLTLHYRRDPSTGSGQVVTWSLDLARRDLRPSAKEQETCRRYFDVPKEAKPNSFKEGVWCVVRLTWEAGKPAEMEVAAPEQLSFIPE